MKLLIKIISYLALGVTIIPSFLVFTGSMSLESSKLIMFIGTIVWFVASPSWINKTEE